MQNRNGTEPTPAGSDEGQRRGVALITALFGVVVLAVMMSGMYFTCNQEYRGTRNALVEQRAFAVAEYGLNSEISNWDRARNQIQTFGIGAIDSNQVYVASGDTAWVKVTRLTDNSFWVVADGQANIGNKSLESRRQTSAACRLLVMRNILPWGAAARYRVGNVPARAPTIRIAT